MLGSAAEQFFRTHEGIKYDIEVDTGTDSVEICANKITKHI